MLTNRLARFLVPWSLAAVACGGSPKPAPAPATQPTAEPAPAPAPADSGEPDPDEICPRIADHAIEVIRTEVEKDLATMPPEQAEKVRSEMTAALSRDELITRCKNDPPDADAFVCITKASTVRELVSCDRKQPSSAERETCVTITDHILPLLITEQNLFENDADDVKTQKTAALSKQLIEACLEREFTSDEVSCILKATTLAAVATCEKDDNAKPPVQP